MNKGTGTWASVFKKPMIFSKEEKAQPLSVAVIDSGIDTAHEDLRSILWEK